MNRRQLLRRSLRFYWRTNLAVVAGVATAVAVLAGALLVGDSVRGTLRDLALSRLGAVDVTVQSPGFFREALARDLADDATWQASGPRIVPVIVRDGMVTAQASGRRAGGVKVYGVDDRFWQFHGIPGLAGPDGRRTFVSDALAEELGVDSGAAVLVRVERPSDVPLESMHARRDDVGRSVRFVVGAVLPSSSLGQFSLDLGQGDVRAAFVPLRELQTALEIDGRVNTLLVAGRASEPGGNAPAAAADLAQRVTSVVGRRVQLGDFGIHVRPLEERRIVSLESDAGLIDRHVEQAAAMAIDGTGLVATPVLTYLANTIRTSTREIPYSLVSGVSLASVAPEAAVPAGRTPPIVLNDWAARDLRARLGESVTLEYFVWVDPGRLETRSADFTLTAVVPTRAIDRDLAPRYPGITDSPTFTDWDPPFPLDLRRVRRVDEDYWDTYRTTPKAYVRLEDAQRLWESRFGALTSIRIAPAQPEAWSEAGPRFSERLRAAIDPWEAGLVVRPVRAEALAASRGATDFGQYFVYFSFFLVVSALVLAALFFRLGVEQRAQEIGLLRAVGASDGMVRRLFLAESGLLAGAGAVLGVAGAIAYGWLVVYALGTWWVDAVRTSAITLHVNAASLLGGAVGAVVAALICTWWTLRGLSLISERSLLTDRVSASARLMTEPLNPMRPLVAALICALLGGSLVVGGAYEVIGQHGAFFGAGSVLLLGGLFLGSYLYRRPARHVLSGHGLRALLWLGLRNAADRPGRSLLSISVIASAVFMLISVEAFRRDAGEGAQLPAGVGGYRLFAESLLPIVDDLRLPEVRASFGLADVDDATIELLRLRPGDDASCLNLYQPQRPRVLGVGASFVAGGRFAFRDSLAESEADRANPWRLLDQPFDDGAIPAIADANSMAYVLHRALGEDIVIETGGDPIRLRLVAALADSVFQSEVVIADAAFTRIFGQDAGYRAMLIETPPGRETEVADRIENALVDFGVDVSSTTARLAEFHRVEGAYLSTFQTLGGLGLIVGTIGLAAVVLRNVLERRRELALLRAVGYGPRDFLVMLLAETGSLLVAGLLLGGLCAVVAIAPPLIERGGSDPFTLRALLLIGAVGAAGLVSTWVAARVATATPLLQSLKSE